MKFKADIGESYDSGIVIFVEAPDAQTAHKLALKQCKENEDVIQIFDEQNKCYFDYENGFARE